MHTSSLWSFIVYTNTDEYYYPQVTVPVTAVRTKFMVHALYFFIDNPGVRNLTFAKICLKVPLIGSFYSLSS